MTIDDSHGLRILRHAPQFLNVQVWLEHLEH
jgi:hypothetical protein